MRKIIFGLIFLLLINSVFAAEMDLNTLNKELTGSTIPMPLDKLIGDEQVNIHFNLENGEKLILGLTTKEGKFESLTMGELKKASLNVYSSESTIKRIESAENPSKALKEAFQNKEITYKAIGFMNKIKFSVLSLMIKMAGGFSEEEEIKEEPVTLEKEETTETIEETNTKETTEENEVITETEEDKTKDTETESAVDENVEEVVKNEEETGPETHLIKLIEGGFDVNDTLEIKVGDTVEWKNVRNSGSKKALIIGSSQCIKIKSPIYNPGESYSWTFDKAETCTIVDGIYTTAAMKVKIS